MLMNLSEIELELESYLWNVIFGFSWQISEYIMIPLIFNTTFRNAINQFIIMLTHAAMSSYSISEDTSNCFKPDLQITLRQQRKMVETSFVLCHERHSFDPYNE